MALIPESAVHREIKENLLRIGWEDGNEKFGIEEHEMVSKYSGLEDSLGDFVLWNVLERKIRELNRAFFDNLTEEEEEKVWGEIRSKLASSGEVEMLEYIKYGVPITVLGRHDKVILIDYDDPTNNIFFFLHEAKYPGFPENIKPDFSLFINGIPIVIIEAKAKGIIELEEVDWRRWSKVHGTEEEALTQIRKYERYSKPLFRFVQFGVAYGDKQLYTPTMPRDSGDAPASEWRYPNEDKPDIFDLLKPERLLDMLRHYTFFFKKNDGRIKVIARWNQYRAAKKIIKRIEKYLSRESEKKNGLIWQWQGSGKTFIMFFVANWFLNRYKKRNPIVFFIVDRIDLEDQHSNIFESVEDREFERHFDRIRSISELRKRIEEIIESEETGRIIPTGLYITTIQKFQYDKFKDMVRVRKVKGEEKFEAEKAVKKPEILFLIDEAHRTQYGRLAAVMRALFPRGMFFGFTGTPIFKRDRNTFQEFAYPKDGEYFLDVYFISDSIRDGFTLDIVHEVIEEEGVSIALDESKLKAFIDAYQLNDPEDVEAFLMGRKKKLKMSSRELAEELRKSRVFLESPKEIERFAEYIAKRIYDDTMGFSFKAMVVAVNREACVHFKKALDMAFKEYFCSKIEELEKDGKVEMAKHFRELCRNAERLSEVVMTYQHNETSEVIEEFKKWLKTRREFQKKDYDSINRLIVEWFQEKDYPKVLIVTDMLLTGFDAPILRVMYLYKPIFEHRLLQAVTRVNRPYPNKETGLVVDGVGLLPAVIRVKNIYEMLARQDPKVLEDFKRNFARSIDEKVEEFENKLQKVKEDLSRIGIEVDILKAFKKQGRWKELEAEMDRVRNILAPIALDFKGNEPKAVRLFNDLHEVISMYRSLGAHPAKLAYIDDMIVVGAIYSTFIRLIDFSRKKSKFWDDLLRFVHEHMEVGPMRELIKVKLSEFSGGEASFEVVARFYKLYYTAEDNIHDPFYKAILERLNRLLEEWINRNIDLKALRKQINILEGQIGEYEKKRAGKTWQESLLESVKFYVKNYLGLEGVEFKKFQRELKRLRRLNPRTVKRLSSSLLDDIMEAIKDDNLNKYRELSKEIDRLVEESIIPEVRKHVRGSA
ncbi:type I restriction endonuclease subunit R [Pyrococcus abyssi]|uniref:type I site-specific deoxyribonuclease n=1 Tax=Pyrococcus abyssi (strain GE5 / Orsay) TaxID=272844 RepID=Q9V1Y1_PYRAB|nr:type I restriction endonuclease subunit R [Pyrococcus abyssi]CAB49217.1 hsdR type I restriction-modification enzyme, R subunit [Pyrococcus abyssi GE5]CCE69671.1 TPA: type I restriction-modification enzyme, R subunit [Pyrococcus abyssi GE5]